MLLPLGTRTHKSDGKELIRKQKGKIIEGVNRVEAFCSFTHKNRK
jgi:hypothetical protein